MSLGPAIFLTALVAGAEPPLADVTISVVSATPAVLPGMALGAAVDADHRLPRGPIFVAARLEWTQASGANEVWIIDHNQFTAAAAIGVAATVGAGRLWAEAGAGASGLHELLSNHQLARIQAAGVPGGTESSFTVGPYGFAEAGIGLRLRDPVRAFIAAGPTLTRTIVDGGALWRVGGQARFGVGYDF
jgi:hypothetical protein